MWNNEKDVVYGEGTDLEEAHEKRLKILLAVGIITGILGLCFLFCIVCFRQSLAIAIDCIDASADYLNGTKRIIFVVVFHFFVGVLVVLLWMGAMVCVASLNTIKGQHEIPFRDWDWEDKPKYMALYMLFGILWITAWIEYANCFIVMVGAASYYFTSNRKEEGRASICKGFKFAYINHSGSIAFGAFIIAVIRFIRLVFMYMAKKAESLSGDNQVVKCVVSCAQSVLKCIEDICDYINKSAFAYIAVTGESFCFAAWHGFLLNLKHLVKFQMAMFLASAFILLGKVVIVIGNCYFYMFIFPYTVNQPVVPEGDTVDPSAPPEAE